MADTLPTLDELVQVFRGALRNAIDPNGTGAFNDRAGSDNAALISMAQQGLAKLLSYAADRARARSLLSAEGDDLDDLGRDLYVEEKLPATQAAGPVYLVRTGTAATSIPQGTRFAVVQDGTQKAVVFEAQADVPVALNQLTAQVNVICQDFGIVGNVATATITNILDPLDDKTWVLYVPGSPGVIGGGSEEETEDEFKARLAQRSLDDDRQRGTKAAVLAGAARVPGVRFVTPVEPMDGTGILYIGDASYLLSSDLLAAARTEIENWRCFGVPVSILSYTQVVVTVTMTIYMQEALKNYDTSKLKSDAVAAVKRYFATERKHPDEYYTDRLEGEVAKAISGIQTFSTTCLVGGISTPNVQRPPDSGYGAVTSLNRYIVNDDSVFVTILDPQTT